MGSRLPERVVYQRRRFQENPGPYRVMARLLLNTILEIMDPAHQASFLSMKILNRDCVDFLVVDDDPALTQFLFDYLKEKGHTCAALTEGFRPPPGLRRTTAKWSWSI